MKKLFLFIVLFFITSCGGFGPTYTLGTIEKTPRFTYKITKNENSLKLIITSLSFEDNQKVDVYSYLYNGEEVIKKERLFVSRMDVDDVETINITNGTKADKICLRYTEGTRSFSNLRGPRVGDQTIGSFCINLKVISK